MQGEEASNRKVPNAIIIMKYTKKLTNLRVATLNIRSLRHKVDDLERLLRKHNIDVIGITETWTDDSITDSTIAIDGFSSVRLDRRTQQGGGVCIYCRNDVPFRARHDLEGQNIEATWIEVGSREKVYFCCAYRPPQEPVSFWDQFDLLLSDPSLRKQRKVVVGDFNVDVTPARQTTSSQHACLEELCATHNLKYNSSSPTRVSLRCPPSTLDLIMDSDESAQENEVVDVSFSDHSMVVCRVKVDSDRLARQKVLSRNLKAIDEQLFREEVAHSCLVNQDVESVDEQWDLWIESFTKVIDNHAPLRLRTPKKKVSVPWMDNTLLRLISRRERLHRKFIRNNRDETAYLEFKLARSHAKLYNRKAKSKYFREKCEMYVGKSKQLWNVINTVTCRKNTRAEPACSVQTLGDVFADTVTDSSRPSLLPIPTHDPPCAHRLRFAPVSVEKVQSLLSRIRVSKATGSDGIPGSLLYLTADIIAPPLTQLFNKSLKSGIFPRCMKIADITPLPKAGDRTLATNYRPVSLLPILSKVLERVVHEQLQHYLTGHNIIPRHQFAYRKYHSTEDALMIASEQLLKAKDDRKTSVAAFLDLSKAFDKVNHSILISDLHGIGIVGAPLEWFRSYLTDRYQRVVVGSERSPMSLVSSGVPQGSVLGPTLFALYVKDLDKIFSSEISLLQYADDILLQTSGSDVCQVAQDLSRAVTSTANWLANRGLILNARKSQVLSLPARNSVNADIHVYCRDIPLPNVSTAKYLGVTIDRDLSWRSHISQKCVDTSRAIGALRRARNCLTIEARYQFYSSVIMGNLLYGSNAYVSNLSGHCRDKLIKLQKKALRAVFGLPPWAHTAPLFVMFGEVNIIDKMLQKLATVVWRTQHKECSDLLSALFHVRTGNRTRGSSSNMIVLPEGNTLAGLHRPSFTGGVIWNALSSETRLSKNRSNFKKFLPASMPKF